MYSAHVLAFLAVLVGAAQSFPWDIVMGGEKRLEFYDNGTVTHLEDIPSAHDITAVTYDPVHFRVLFVDHDIPNVSINSFDITTRKMQTLVMRETAVAYYLRLAYDPLTQLLFWTEYNKLYSMSLKPASSNEAVDGNLIVTLGDYCYAIAVDSCGGHVYWTTEYNIERASFDGSEREVLIDAHVYWRLSLVIDQQTEKMYWIERLTNPYQYSIESADLNGRNRRTFYSIGSKYNAAALTVSKDFIYWRSETPEAIVQLPKHQQHDVAPVVYSQTSTHCWYCPLTATNYTIEEQTLGIKSCEALKSLIPDVEERHGSICHNYCLQGNCSVSAEGHPKCSCEAGYSGERCEVNACYMYCLNNGVCSLNEARKPVCKCAADYEGERCDVFICKDYCMQGNCSVSTEGERTCRCDAGYSGERCEVNACHSYCLNNGDCSLNEEDEPVCECTAGYEGARCDVATTLTDVCVCADKSKTQQILRILRSKMDQVISEELQCTL